MSGTPTMAEVIAAHKIMTTGYLNECRYCGLFAGPAYAHQAEQLAAAGYGSRRDAAVEALTQAVEDLPALTEGENRSGLKSWPQDPRDVYSLAIEEAQDALWERATKIGDRNA